MKSYRLPLAIVLLVISFWFSTQAVVGTKFLELQIHIEKDVLQNFELSSRLLELKFKEMVTQNNNIKSEIEQYVLAVTVLNELDVGDIEVSWLHHGGIQIINSVRLLSLKPLIDFWRERELFLILKYAFYLERNRRIPAALKEYERFIENSSDKRSNSVAFAMLHQGYCHALLNHMNASLEKTSFVIDNFSGSHYSRTARTLRKLLLERKKRRQIIEARHQGLIGKATAYFEAGDYYIAKQLYESMGALTVAIDMYRYARVNEEIGKIKEAVQGYKNVIEKKSNSKAAVLSNRRLLLIGNLYGGGKEIREYAEKKAIQLRDKELAVEIKTIMANLPEATVVKESSRIKQIREAILAKERQEAQQGRQKNADRKLVQQQTPSLDELLDKQGKEEVSFFLVQSDQEEIDAGKVTPLPVDYKPEPRKANTSLLNELTSKADIASTIGWVRPERAEEKEPHIQQIEPSKELGQTTPSLSPPPSSGGFFGGIASSFGIGKTDENTKRGSADQKSKSKQSASKNKAEAKGFLGSIGNVLGLGDDGPRTTAAFDDSAQQGSGSFTTDDIAGAQRDARRQETQQEAQQKKTQNKQQLGLSNKELGQTTPSLSSPSSSGGFFGGIVSSFGIGSKTDENTKRGSADQKSRSKQSASKNKTEAKGFLGSIGNVLGLGDDGPSRTTAAFDDSAQQGSGAFATDDIAGAQRDAQRQETQQEAQQKKTQNKQQLGLSNKELGQTTPSLSSPSSGSFFGGIASSFGIGNTDENTKKVSADKKSRSKQSVSKNKTESKGFLGSIGNILGLGDDGPRTTAAFDDSAQQGSAAFATDDIAGAQRDAQRQAAQQKKTQNKQQLGLSNKELGQTTPSLSSPSSSGGFFGGIASSFGIGNTDENTKKVSADKKSRSKQSVSKNKTESKGFLGSIGNILGLGDDGPGTTAAFDDSAQQGSAAFATDDIAGAQRDARRQETQQEAQQKKTQNKQQLGLSNKELGQTTPSLSSPSSSGGFFGGIASSFGIGKTDENTKKVSADPKSKSKQSVSKNKAESKGFLGSIGNILGLGDDGPRTTAAFDDSAQQGSAAFATDDIAGAQRDAQRQETQQEAQQKKTQNKQQLGLSKELGQTTPSLSSPSSSGGFFGGIASSFSIGKTDENTKKVSADPKSKSKQSVSKNKTESKGFLRNIDNILGLGGAKDGLKTTAAFDNFGQQRGDAFATDEIVRMQKQEAKRRKRAEQQAFDTSLKALDATKKQELEIASNKPLPYLLVTTQNGSLIWGKKIVYVSGYLRINFAGTAYLIKPSRLQRLISVSIRGRNTRRRKAIFIRVEYDGGPPIVTPSFAKEADKDGFIHQGEFIPYKDIKKIEPLDL